MRTSFAEAHQTIFPQHVNNVTQHSALLTSSSERKIVLSYFGIYIRNARINARLIMESETS